MSDLRGYDAVRSGAGIALRRDRARLVFTGDDHASFLHNILSNDVASLVPGAGCYANVLRQDSKVVGDVEVLVDEAWIFLDLEAAARDRVRAHLERFLVAEDVEIEAATAVILGVYGPAASGLLGGVGLDAPMEILAHGDGSVGGVPVRVVRVERTGGSGFELHLAPENASALEERLLGVEGASPVGEATLEVLRLEGGFPRAGIDFDETRLVLEAALERGIHFRKGCYLGQEIVERQTARGHVNRKRVGLRLEGEAVPEPGAVIRTAERAVGEVTSAVFSPELGVAIAFGYVRREAMEPGSRLEIEVGSGSLPAEVVATPFVRRP